MVVGTIQSARVGHQILVMEGSTSRVAKVIDTARSRRESRIWSQVLELLNVMGEGERGERGRRSGRGRAGRVGGVRWNACSQSGNNSSSLKLLVCILQLLGTSLPKRPTSWWRPSTSSSCRTSKRTSSFCVSIATSDVIVPFAINVVAVGASFWTTTVTIKAIGSLTEPCCLPRSTVRQLHMI